MNWIARLLVFAAAMSLGMIAAAVFSGFGSSGLSNCIINVRGTAPDSGFKTAPSPKGIRVVYAGVDRNHYDSEARLKFVIYNGLSYPVSYRSHQPDSPSPTLKANGVNIRNLLDCGTSMQNFSILPGESAEVHVYNHRFTERPRKADTITAGFYLKPAFAKEYETHTSEPFLLPEEFRESIKPIPY